MWLNAQKFRDLSPIELIESIQTPMILIETNGGWNDTYKEDYMRRLVVWFDYCLKDVPLPEWFQYNR